MKEERFSGYRMVVVCCVFLFLIFGANASFPTMLKSIVAENNMQLADAALYTTFCAGISAVLGFFVTPILLKKVPARALMCVAAVCMILNSFILSKATQYWQIYLAGSLAGLAQGVGAIATCSALVASWFIKKRTQMTGYVAAASGLGAAGFTALIGVLSETHTYRQIYTIFTVLVGVLVILCILLIRSTPSSMGQKPLGFGEEEAVPEAKVETGEASGLTLSEARRKPALWVIYLFNIIGMMGYYSVIMYMQTLLTTVGGMSTLQAAMINTVYALYAAFLMTQNARVRKWFGPIGYYVVTGIFVLCGTLVVAVLAPNAFKFTWIYYVATFFIAFAAVRATLDSQSATVDLFGMKDYSSIQAMLVSAQTFGQILAAPLLKLLTQGIGLELNRCYFVYAVLIIIPCIGFLIAYKITPQKYWDRAK